MKRIRESQRPNDDKHCYGCDKPFPRACYHDEHVPKCEQCRAGALALAEVWLAPGKKVKVCASMRGWRDKREPLVNCGRMAQARAGVCPGCGAEGSRKMSIADGRDFSVCNDCERALERDHVRAAEDVEARKFFSVSDSYMIFPRAGGVDYPFAVLVAALGGKIQDDFGLGKDKYGKVDGDSNLTPKGASGRYLGEARKTFEIRASQAPALKRFLGWLAAVVEERYAEGKRAGLDLLGQLSRGEVSTAEFDAKAGKR